MASSKPPFSLHHSPTSLPTLVPACVPSPTLPPLPKVGLAKRSPSPAFVWLLPDFCFLFFQFTSPSQISVPTSPPSSTGKSISPGSCLPAGTYSAQRVSVLFRNLEECVDEFIPIHQTDKLNTMECRGGYSNVSCFLVKGSYKS